MVVVVGGRNGRDGKVSNAGVLLIHVVGIILCEMLVDVGEKSVRNGIDDVFQDLLGGLFGGHAGHVDYMNISTDRARTQCKIKDEEEVRYIGGSRLRRRWSYYMWVLRVKVRDMSTYVYFWNTLCW